MRRVMCIWCPLWPVQRLRVEQPELSSSLILFAESRRGLYVTACSPEAARQGVRCGMPLGEARTLLPETSKHVQRRPVLKPVFRRADPLSDRARLQRLALQYQRYSPLVGLEDLPEPESLWLDISGNEALFGGENGLIETLQADLVQQGFHARIAIADTWGTAWAVSHFSSEVVSIVPPIEQSRALASLPVVALRLPAPVIDSLQTLDVSTIDRLMQLPRTALPSRFGKELLRRLDQALGTVPELLPVERSVEPLSVEWLFEEPITDRKTLEHVLGILLDQLLGLLNDRRVSLREVHCRWLGTTAEPMSLRLLRPSTDRSHLLELLRLHCEQQVFSRRISGVRMEVVEMGLPPVRQARLFEDHADKTEQHQRALAELVDRLDSRLGRQAVLRPSLRPDPQPEFACEGIPWLGSGGFFPSEAPPALCSSLRCRPLQLLRSPQPLQVNGPLIAGLPTQVNRSPIVRMIGPERIETGWWRGMDAKRDYYRLDLVHGAAMWTFFDRNSGGWFLHGLFA